MIVKLRCHPLSTSRQLRLKILSEYSKSILRHQNKKGLPFGNPFFYMAEAQRFELWNPFGSPVFKTGAFNRSATLPV